MKSKEAIPTFVGQAYRARSGSWSRQSTYIVHMIQW